MKKLLENLSLKVGAAASVYMMTTGASFAANGGLATVGTAWKNQIEGATPVINGGLYVAGAGMGAAGVMKLRAHAENPQNAPLGHGLGRIAAAGGLLGLPFVVDMAASSITGGGTGNAATYRQGGF